ncbi:hypothetical protein ACLESO_29955 [Pyxidicoccus sp. 3LG]
MPSEPRNRVLEKMLERLYAALASGPSLNCRPHHSRQRVDLATLSRLDGTAPHTILATLLGEKAEIRLAVKPPAPGARGDKTPPLEARASRSGRNVAVPRRADTERVSASRRPRLRAR